MTRDIEIKDIEVLLKSKGICVVLTEIARLTKKETSYCKLQSQEELRTYKQLKKEGDVEGAVDAQADALALKMDAVEWKFITTLLELSTRASKRLLWPI